MYQLNFSFLTSAWFFIFFSLFFKFLIIFFFFLFSISLQFFLSSNFWKNFSISFSKLSSFYTIFHRLSLSPDPFLFICFLTKLPTKLNFFTLQKFIPKKSIHVISKVRFIIERTWIILMIHVFSNIIHSFIIHFHNLSHKYKNFK